MVVDLRQHVAELAVVSLFAVAGFVAVCWLAAGAAERLADWWRDRERPVDPPWWWKPWLYRRAERDDLEELPPPLPPERTWEQMTSHQLPVALPDPTHSATPATARDSAWSASFGAERERRAPWWEAEHRAAYESLGFDYPSGLMARVREQADRPTQADVSRWIAKLGPVA